MDGPLANVLTVFPLTAPLVLPARSALVGVPLWEHAAAVVLVLATIYWLVCFAGRIYGQGLLRSGPRLGVRAAAPHPPLVTAGLLGPALLQASVLVDPVVRLAGDHGCAIEKRFPGCEH